MDRSGDGCDCGGVESAESAGVDVAGQVEALASERAAWVRKRLVKLRSKRRQMVKELGVMSAEERRLDLELRKLHSLRSVSAAEAPQEAREAPGVPSPEENSSEPAEGSSAPSVEPLSEFSPSDGPSEDPAPKQPLPKKAKPAPRKPTRRRVPVPKPKAAQTSPSPSPE